MASAVRLSCLARWVTCNSKLAEVRQSTVVAVKLAIVATTAAKVVFMRIVRSASQATSEYQLGCPHLSHFFSPCTSFFGVFKVSALSGYLVLRGNKKIFRTVESAVEIFCQVFSIVVFIELMASFRMCRCNPVLHVSSFVTQESAYVNLLLGLSDCY